MEVIIIVWALFGGLIWADTHFDNNKAVSCEGVTRFESNDLEIKKCLAIGKIEQGTKEIEEVNDSIKKVNEIK